MAVLGVRARDEPAKSRAVAILLALLIGFFGVHWFYLGRYRQGFLYVALLPLLMLSMFLGWYDVLRFIWVDRAEFERRFVRPSVV